MHVQIFVLHLRFPFEIYINIIL